MVIMDLEEQEDFAVINIKNNVEIILIIKNIFHSMGISLSWAILAYSTQIINALFTIIVAVISAILVFFVNRYLRKKYK